ATCWTSCDAVRTSPSRIAGGVAVRVRAGSPAQRRVRSTARPWTSGAASERSVVNIPAAVGLQVTVMTAGAAGGTANVGEGETVNGDPADIAVGVASVRSRVPWFATWKVSVPVALSGSTPKSKIV